MDYDKLAAIIIEKVGGENNVNDVIHCATRLRFNLKDRSKADTEEIKNLEDVITVIESGGQYQVVIGDQVSEVYKHVINILGINFKDEVDAKDFDQQEDQSIFDKILGIVSGIFTPVIGILAASGILKGFLTALIVVGLIDDTSGVYQVLFAASDAFYYFLPIFLGFTAAKVFKTNQFMGAAMGAALVYPTLVEMATSGAQLSFLNIPVVLMNYTQSVVPVIVSVYFLSVVEKFLNKVIPKTLKMIFVPLLILIIVVPISLMVVGPVTQTISNLLADGALALYGLSPLVAGLLLASIWQVTVIFGLHWAFIPIFINNISVYGFDPINAMLYCTVFAQTGAALAVMLKTKDAKLKGLATTATISGFLGITEPAIYGVNLPTKKPFIMACIGSGVGGAIAGAFGANMFGGFASGGVFGIPMFIDPSTGVTAGFIGFLISLGAAFLISTLLTYFIGFKEDKVLTK
ncbi:PTS transporter subunit EIIC [Marinilactibacillus piezotolerans]|uniref:PTS transporter subunit EIIC n=1 Tax=Marinilactibacillus piezotolerans TaxID=258723 RepID=UPI0009AF7108|nr:PTS transporter subunit EIIC [Marinilactibacillus piezotolerans]